MSNLSLIVSALENEGLTNRFGIAGVLGNLEVESGINSNALNGREGAIGFGQWEGDRRIALQDFARARGTSESDPATQAAFLVQEMKQRGTFAEMQNATSAAQAASLFDQHFEVSAGTSRSQRIADAQQYATTGSLPESTSSYGATQLSAVPTLTPQQRADAIKQGSGELYQLCLAVPELRQLLNTAITTGQSAADFQNSVENSQWYRTHSDSVRQAIVLRQSDPQTYQKNLLQATAAVKAMAQQEGVNLGSMTNAVALRYMTEGWNSDQLNQFFQTAHVAWNFQSGNAGQAMLQMKQVAADYGVPVTDAAYDIWARNIATGVSNIDNFKQRMIQDASSIYPGLVQGLTAGQTTKQLADPYISTMANTLELDPNTINWSTDPLIKRALQTPAQTTGTNTPGSAQPPGTTPLWQFEQQLRQDPRWQYTDNAKSATASALTDLGKAWGFAS